MRRRLTFAILGTVLATLLVAGFGTLLLARLGARANTEEDLRDQTAAIAALLELQGEDVRPNRDFIRQRLNQVRNALELDDFTLIVLGPENAMAADLSDPLPRGLDLDDLDLRRLRAGEIVSGDVGTRVFAAAATTPDRPSTGVVILIEPVEPAVGPAFGWFVLASIAALLLGTLIALRIGRQFTQPLRAATDATKRIAAGDLAARLPATAAGRDELAELTTSINQMAATLERSRGVEQQFLLSISHDLRTPLTSIRGYSEAIADGTATDPGAAASVILDESRRLERLVRDLLDLARLESQDFTIAVQPLDLVDATRRSAEAFAPAAGGDGVVLDIVLPDHEVPVLADADRLAQLLANLIENALKYAATRIEVRVVDDAGRPRIEVSDDGPGIAREDLPHVFERLYVTKLQPVRKEVGSGLGLAIVNNLAIAMGGTAHAEPLDGRGTRFVVVLPATPPEPPQNA
jgi:two-component system sensor histidine kinase BaeS